MNLGTLAIPKGAYHRPKRLGRGRASGHGKTSTRGIKGQRARTGEGRRPGFEGGQTPLIRRLPKRGFTSRSRTLYQVVNLGDLARLSGKASVTPQDLQEAGLIKDAKRRVKILGEGDIGQPLTIQADRISTSALEKLKARGGVFTPLTRR